MVIATIVSIAIAVISAVIAWRAIRREALRSDARVAVLASAIDGVTASESFDWPDEVEVDTAVAPIPAPALFEATHHTHRRPLLTAGAALVAVLGVVVMIAMTGNRYDTSTHAQTTSLTPLELMSMRYAREGNTLAVTGLVRNQSSAPASAMTATVSAFGRDGQVVGTGSSPLSALAPGDERVFVVTIPDVNDLARYRVSFHTSTGVVPHVDRRPGRASDAS